MRPVPLAAGDVWPGATSKVIAGPDGDLTGDIRPVEAIFDTGEFGPRIVLKIGVDERDRASLEANGHFWLIIHAGHLHVFGLALEEDRAR